MPACWSGRSYRSAREGHDDAEDVLRPRRVHEQFGEAGRGPRPESTSVHSSSNWSTTRSSRSPAATRSDATATRPSGFEQARVHRRGVVGGRRHGATRLRARRADRCPGTIDTTSAPRRRNSGTMPAWTSELLPEPEGPTTATNGLGVDRRAAGATRARLGRGSRRRRPHRNTAQSLVRVRADGGHARDRVRHGSAPWARPPGVRWSAGCRHRRRRGARPARSRRCSRSDPRDAARSARCNTASSAGHGHVGVPVERTEPGR